MSCSSPVEIPKTGECFSSQGDGTLTVIKEKSPTSFEVTQTLKTLPRAKTLTLDSKTGKILLIAAEYGAAPTTGSGNREQNRGSGAKFQIRESVFRNLDALSSVRYFHGDLSSFEPELRRHGQ
ncbi:hypothetical protein [Armatimonas sp.]|uniref:hypothetical protein n=1 Tax=Armatimonas sp. TaxID=1872638 RepID=UPI003753CCE6